MKKIILYFACLLFANFIMAQSVVVLHSTSTTTVFTGNTAFQDAYALSESGDTLYLSGGSFTISSDIEKGLKIFGAGIHPDSTSATYITQINGTMNIKNGADGLYFEGIQFENYIYEHYTQAADDVSFVRCRFNYELNFYYSGGSGTPSVYRENYAFIQCVFIDMLNLKGITNSLITNCIVNNRIYNSNSNWIKNSSFLYSPTISSYFIISTSNSNIISNCVFHATGSYISNIISGSSNTAQNCVTNSASPSFGTLPVLLNNYNGVDLSTFFISLPSNSFSIYDNYHLTTSAETTYLGDDGTQVGVYGGLSPLKEGFVPKNPHISAKTIAPSTDENGLLDVEIEVNAQDN